MRPTRETATNNGQTYFVTSNTAGRTPLFRHERWARLFIETLYNYRFERYFIHGFTVMPDHFHCLLTPQVSLELAIQCLKGGFSFRAKKEFAWKGDIWIAGFSDHRIRDEHDFEIHQRYIDRNAVKARLVEREEDYAYCSAGGLFEVDAFPQGLKPDLVTGTSGAAKAAPFQSNDGMDDPTIQGNNGVAEAAPLQRLIESK
jgi:REP element-mobilizing transposase RayT